MLCLAGEPLWTEHLVQSTYYVDHARQGQIHLVWDLKLSHYWRWGAFKKKEPPVMSVWLGFCSMVESTRVSEGSSMLLSTGLVFLPNYLFHGWCLVCTMDKNGASVIENSFFSPETRLCGVFRKHVLWLLLGWSRDLNSALLLIPHSGCFFDSISKEGLSWEGQCGPTWWADQVTVLVMTGCSAVCWAGFRCPSVTGTLDSPQVRALVSLSLRTWGREDEEHMPPSDCFQ